MLPVGVAVYPGGTILASGAILSGAKRWNAGQSELEVVFGAAADTTGVTSFSLGLWGRDPVTGQEVPLTPEQGTYELIVGASSISMLVGMPFANGLRGPTTRIRVPKAPVQFVESFSVVGVSAHHSHRLRGAGGGVPRPVNRLGQCVGALS